MLCGSSVVGILPSSHACSSRIIPTRFPRFCRLTRTRPFCALQIGVSSKMLKALPDDLRHGSPVSVDTVLFTQVRLVVSSIATVAIGCWALLYTFFFFSVFFPFFSFPALCHFFFEELRHNVCVRAEGIAPLCVSHYLTHTHTQTWSPTRSAWYAVGLLSFQPCI